MRTLFAWLTSIDGATAIEYALLAGGISIGIIATIFFFGDDLTVIFNTTSVAMNNAAKRM